MTDIKGKIEKINLNNTGTKRDGTPFTNIKIKLEGITEIVTISKSSPAGKFINNLNLKVGDDVTIVKGGQWNSVQKIMKGSGFTPSSQGGKTFEGKKSAYDGDGAKRGQAMNAAVALLIHNHKNGLPDDLEVLEDQLETLARLVFKVSTSLETKSEIKTEVNPYEQTKDTPKVTEDFANADDVDF